MIKTLLVAALAGGSGFAGWIGGSIYPAPPEWTDAVNREANDLRARVRLENVTLPGLRELMPGVKFDELKTQLNAFAAQAGEVILIERGTASSFQEELDNLAMDAGSALPTGVTVVDAPAATPAPAPASAPASAPVPTEPAASIPPPPKQQVVVAAPPPIAGAAVFAARLSLCPRMEIANAPAHDKDLLVTAFKQMVDVKGVRIATFPVKDACMSSGFGRRSERLHKGVDYHADVGVPVLAGGDGKIIEMKYRDDYGNMVLIDHGGGVYTRYAHMASFARGLVLGATLKAGEQIGLMGNTASYQIPMHLHYELLLGDYANPKASFGLEPEDPMSFPAVK